MLLYIYYDELSYIYEPHGTQTEVWSTTLEGSEVLKASGWRPFEMQRVSRHLHLGLLSGGHLYEGANRTWAGVTGTLGVRRPPASPLKPHVGGAQAEPGTPE